PPRRGAKNPPARPPPRRRPKPPPRERRRRRRRQRNLRPRRPRTPPWRPDHPGHSRDSGCLCLSEPPSETEVLAFAGMTPGLNMAPRKTTKLHSSPKPVRHFRVGTLPSREAILEAMAERPELDGKRDLAKHFGIHGDMRTPFKVLLKQM